MQGFFTLMVFVVFLVGLLAGLWGAFIYTGLSGARRKCAAALLEIQAALESRYEMLPELVETARGYMRHEREALESVLAATTLASGALQKLRSAALGPGCFDGVLQAEEVLEGGVMKLFAISGVYPELKADPKMRQLVQLFLEREARVQECRAAFNDAVKTFNQNRREFPASYVVRLMGIGEGISFEKSEDGGGEDS